MDQSFDRELRMHEGGVVVIDPRQSFTAAMAWSRAHAAELLCGALLLVMSFQMLFVISRKSITNDETVLIPAAYYHLVTDDIQLVREHPPLCKFLAGVPILLIQPTEPTEHARGPRGDVEWFYAMRFWDDNQPLFGTISFWARVPMILLTIAFGVLIFVFARQLFGARAALMTVALFTLEPTVLAHGRVVQTDVPAAFGYLLVCFTVYRYLLQPNWRWALPVGCASGVAMLAKFSMLIVGPILLVIFLFLFWRRARRRALAGHALTAILGSWFVVNAAYFFHSRTLTTEDEQWVALAFPSASNTVMMSLRWLSHLLPTDFLLGIYWQLWHSQEGHGAGLLGMYSQKGWWYYFPVAFALKSTIPFLLLSIAALIWATYLTVRKRDLRYGILVVGFALYTMFVLGSTIDIGVRYYLPAYAFLLILGGALLERLLQFRKLNLGIAIVSIVIAWCGAEAVRAFPHHMSYLNEFASQQPHWWYLSDSNVEWGDDVKGLAEYLRARGENRVRAMLLGGFITLKFYGVDYVDATADNDQSPRYLALGASFLNGSTVPFRQTQEGTPMTNAERVNTFDEYRHRTPEAIIGDSIYVYRVHD